MNNSTYNFNTINDTMYRIEGETKGKGGRKAKEVDYKEVEFNDNKYIIGTVKFNNTDLKFVFDAEDFDKVKSRNWHAYCDGNYIGSNIVINGSKKALGLHNFVMDKLTFEGKGQGNTIDHINRIGLDNRKCNLRPLSASEQSINQSKKERRCVLPENCGILPEEIPKHIWYIKANGLHGDRFGIDLKTENLKWKTTSSKSVSLKDKLEQAKSKLEEFYIQFPYLKQINNEELSNKLKEEYETIITL